MFKKLLRSSSGGVAPMAAVLFTTLMGVAGAAVDYTTLANKRAKAQHSLDSAVMTAAIKYLENGNFKKARREGRRIYKVNCIDDFCRSSKNPILTLDNDLVVGKVDGLHKTYFLQVVGVSELRYKANSAVNVRNTGNVDVVVLADVSGSMDIPDSPAGIRLMQQNFSPFGEGCAFACHANYDRANGAPIAKQLGIYMRRDRIRDAIKSVSRDLLREDGVRMALYSFDEEIRMHSDFTDKPRQIRRAVNAIPDQSKTTHLNNALRQIAEKIGPAGNGSENDPGVALVLMTDGVESLDPDSPQILEPEACDPLKELGWDIYIVNIEYPVSETLRSPSRNGPEDIYLRENEKRIPGKLRACATNEQYFDGKFGPQLTGAIRDTFASIEKPPAQPYFVK